MNAFDAPVPAVDGQYPLRRGLLRYATRDPQPDRTRAIDGGFLEGFTLDQKDLPDVGNVEVRIERRSAPHAPRLKAAVNGRRDLDEVGGCVLLEQQCHIAVQRVLVVLDGEVIEDLPLDQIACLRTLGQ